MKNHVQESGGVKFCAHCGGAVDAEGFAEGGMVDEAEGEDEAMREGDTDDMPQQLQGAQRMRAAAFADAVSRRAR